MVENSKMGGQHLTTKTKNFIEKNTFFAPSVTPKLIPK